MLPMRELFRQEQSKQKNGAHRSDDARNRAPNLNGADMNIAGLDKAVVLASLYNRSFQQGMGVLDKNGRQEMNVEQARKHLDLTHDFDYLNGRVMKIDLSSAEVDTWLYNRENGEGAAERIIEQIRASMPPEIKQSTRAEDG